MGITYEAGDSPENTSWVTGKQLSLPNSFGVKGVLGLSDCGPCLLRTGREVPISECRGMVLGVRGPRLESGLCHLLIRL